ncbi:unnamed protein product [Plutella xylostella]|uniref:(diamondback moth) hypothetical protein n=1 Tax=Plutella xylostella TaxID=51655 RepID=A0A8S4DCP9_PLUXY|nr:unnamed protein product [Plutella xylostella]
MHDVVIATKYQILLAESFHYTATENIEGVHCCGSPINHGRNQRRLRSGPGGGVRGAGAPAVVQRRARAAPHAPPPLPRRDT